MSLAPAERLEALEAASEASGRAVHLLEKDVWVVWALGAMFSSPLAPSLTFKGGTSLSKVYKVIHRFSEDVDLTIDIHRLLGGKMPDGIDDGRFEIVAQNASRARKASEMVRAHLPEFLAKEVEPFLGSALQKDELAATLTLDGDKILLNYDPVARGTGYVSPRVLLEFGARSMGEPVHERDVACDAAHMVEGLTFPVACPRVMYAERTFWEKATAIHVYCRQDKPVSDRFARHWHDLAKLAEAGIASAAIQRGDIAEAVALHKKYFFSAKGRDGKPVDYEAAVHGAISLVPEGEALTRLREDHDNMQADDLLDQAQTFDELMAKCSTIEGEINGAPREDTPRP